jgi:cystathionine beta-lyase/cystathionine gamma-synthase
MSFDEERSKEGYTGNLIRFYAGLDEPDSLINDFDQDQAFIRIRRSV